MINKEEKKYIKKFKIKIFLMFSLCIICLIGLYLLFVYLTNPEYFNIYVKVGIVAYIIGTIPAIIFMNKLIKRDENLRQTIIDQAKKKDNV